MEFSVSGDHVYVDFDALTFSILSEIHPKDDSKRQLFRAECL